MQELTSELLQEVALNKGWEDPSYAEKDFHVVRVLSVCSLLDFSQFGAELIFAGGTCLSKAYGLLGRMSEDVDLKIHPIPDSCFPNSRSGVRRVMRDLRNILFLALEEAGFSLVEENGMTSRNEYRHTEFLLNILRSSQLRHP